MSMDYPVNFSNIMFIVRNNWRTATIFALRNKIVLQNFIVYQTCERRRFWKFLKRNKIVELAAEVFQSGRIIAGKRVTLVHAITLVHNSEFSFKIWAYVKVHKRNFKFFYSKKRKKNKFLKKETFCYSPEPDVSFWNIQIG